MTIKSTALIAAVVFFLLACNDNSKPGPLEPLSKDVS